MNNLTITGKLKNLKEFTQYGILVTGNLTQRNGDGKCITTMPIISKDNAIADTLRTLPVDSDNLTPEVKITGRLLTKFDTRRDVANEDRYAPRTQIYIESVELVSSTEDAVTAGYTVTRAYEVA